MSERQYNEKMKDWLVLTTKTGKHEDGFPVGEFLCQHGIEDAKEFAKRLNFSDDEIIIRKYNE